MKSAIKEIFIGALILMVIIFTLGILFYDSMPDNIESSSITYTAEASVTSAIQEISAESETSTSSSSSTLEDELLNIGSVIASYSLGSSELSLYAARNTYESGKSDPFAEYVEPESSEGTTENNGNSAENSTNSTSGTTTNSSTGRLFENKTTK